MAEKVEIIIEAEDQVSGTVKDIESGLQDMGAAAGDAVQPVDDLGAAVTQMASVETAEAINDLKNAFADLGGAVADIGTSAIGAAAEVETIQAQLGIALKNFAKGSDLSAKGINDMASAMQDLSGVDADSIVQASTKLLAFGVDSQDTFDRASKAAVGLSLAFGVDLNTAMTGVARSLQNPEAGFGRLALKIGDLTQAEKDTIAAMVEAGDTAGAQEYMLGLLEAKAGDAAAVMGGTYAQSVERANNVQGDFMEMSGGKFLAFFQGLPQPVQDSALALQTWGGTISSLLGPLSSIVIIAGGLGKGGAFAGIGAKIAAALAGAIPAATAGATAIGVALLAALQGVFINGLSKLAASAGQALGNALGIEFSPQMKALQDLIIKNGPFSATTWSLVAANVKTGINNAGNAIKSGLASWKGNFDNLKTILNQLGAQFNTVGRGIVNGIWAGIQSGWTWLKTQIQNSMTSLLSWVKSILGISSPSKVWAAAIGKPIAQGIGAGFGAEMGGAGETFSAPLMPRSGAATAGGGGVTVVYSPTFSAASMQEFEQRLIPLIDRQMTLNQRRRV